MSFKDEVWEEESINSPTTECKRKIMKRWKALPPALKSPYLREAKESIDNDAQHCICRGDSGGIDWVVCDCCNVWYHCTCVGMTKNVADVVPFYTCPPCMKS